MTAAVIVAFALALALLGVLVVGLLRSHAEILRALHDLGVNLEEGAPAPTLPRATTASRHGPVRTADGVPAPRSDGPLGDAVDIAGQLPRGGSAHVAVRDVDHSTLLAFLSTGCGTCGTFWEALRQDPSAHLADPATRVVVVTNGPEAESPAAVADLAPPDIVTVMASEAWDAYHVPVSPYFILVDGPSGRVTGEGAGTSWEQVLDLLAKAEADTDLRRRELARPVTRMGGQDRADRVDRELRAAGIEPGDPSLYPAIHPSHVGEDRR